MSPKPKPATLPKVHMVHSVPGRVRLRIPERRGHEGFFIRLAEELGRLTQGVEDLEIQTNPATGSLLLSGPAASPEVLEPHLKALGLDELVREEALSMPRIVSKPVTRLDQDLLSFSAGQLDVRGLLFLGLTAVGLVQMVRQRLSPPAWHTALWYAFGLYTVQGPPALHGPEILTGQTGQAALPDEPATQES